MTETPNDLGGWEYLVVPGWPTESYRNHGRLERAGNVLLPQSFTLVATNKRESEAVFLCFVVNEGEVKMSAVMSTHSDVPTGLDTLRSVAPIESWKRLAIIKMTHWLATTDPDTASINPFLSDSSKAAGEDWLDVLRAWQAASPQHDLRETLQAAASLPIDRVKRKRNRITKEHLEAVAEVYRNADAAGAPPTRAVQEVFGTTHSTAAKWVAQARKQGILGPPPGSRGGEVSNPVAAAIARPIAEAAARTVSNRIRNAVADSMQQGESGEGEE
ncbi:hypothetical protein [Streptomyces sp. NPDC020996]|uniref:hypothetical protein n=1 Tax=Streptomyces sp. NPDC020996 TaxID=3154791 RepID=UPI0033F28F0C